MRILLAVTFLLASFAFAQDNPAAGTWKLNRAQSTMSAPLPEPVHNGVMKIDREIVTAPRTPRPAGQAVRLPVFKMDLSTDGRTLTLTRPGAEPNVKFVFDRQ